jgi:hypothetical protein
MLGKFELARTPTETQSHDKKTALTQDNELGLNPQTDGPHPIMGRPLQSAPNKLKQN